MAFLVKTNEIKTGPGGSVTCMVGKIKSELPASGDRVYVWLTETEGGDGLTDTGTVRWVREVQGKFHLELSLDKVPVALPLNNAMLKPHRDSGEDHALAVLAHSIYFFAHTRCFRLSVAEEALLASRLKATPPMIMFHTVWMDRYDGDLDTIFTGNFAGPKEYGHGHELYNFRPIDGYCYGHVQAQKAGGEEKRIQIAAHFDIPSGADRMDGVLVLWTAPHPDTRRRTLVGWYRNAKLFRDPQIPEGDLKGALDHGMSTRPSYRAVAAEADCFILPIEQRTISFPAGSAGQKGLPTQSTVFYPDDPRADSTAIDDFKAKAWALIEAYGGTDYGPAAGLPSPTRPKANSKGAWQQDVERRLAIEKAAVTLVATHYENQGYVVDSRERENVGYDLLAVKGRQRFCIEVKGRSGPDIVADFTPNEYRCIQAAQTGSFEEGHYRICIVTNALDAPKLWEFCLLPVDGGTEWRSVAGMLPLTFAESTAARGSIPS